MKTSESFENTALFPPFPLKVNYPDLKNVPKEISTYNSPTNKKLANREYIFFDSNFSNQKNSIFESKGVTSTKMNGVYQEKQTQNLKNCFLYSKKLNDLSLFQKKLFFKKDEKIWSQINTNKFRSNVHPKTNYNDEMINPNIIKDKNDGKEFPYLKAKEDMNIEHNGILNDFTQNLNYLINNNTFNAKNNKNVYRTTNYAFNQISQEANSSIDNISEIKKDSNLKLNINLINNYISLICRPKLYKFNINNNNFYYININTENAEEKNCDDLNTEEELDFQRFKNFCIKLSIPLFNYICSKTGSKKISKFINQYNDLKINYLIEELFPNFERIICDKYGNYFFQKLYVMSQKDYRIKILTLMNNYFITISKNKIGVRAMQNIIRVMQTEEERIKIIQYLNGNELEMSLDNEGTHLMQSIIEVFPEKERQNLTDVLCTSKNIKKLLKSINGFHIIKRLIQHNKIIFTRNKLIQVLFLNFNIMLKSSKGCYIIYYLIDKWGINSGIVFINELISNFEYYYNNNKESVILINKIILLCKKNCLLYMLYLNANMIDLSNCSEFIILKTLEILISKFNF